MIYTICPQSVTDAILDTQVPTGYVKVVATTYDYTALNLSYASDWTTSFVCVEGMVRTLPVGLADLLYEDQALNPDGEWNISAA